MSFKIITDHKRQIFRAFWIILGILAIIFFARVAIWEHSYYKEKEGSIRDVKAVVTEPEEELIEIKPTEVEIAEYFVEPDRPRYIYIDKLGIQKTRVIPVGTTRTGALAAPNNIFDVGWYESSSKPGQGGTLLMDGHSGGPHEYGIFKELNALAEGDIIKIERGDGTIFSYKVWENVSVPLDKADSYMRTAMTTPSPGDESLSLISCTGEWSNVQRTFLSRQFVRAVLVK